MAANGTSPTAHRAGFLNLVRILRYCCELGVACISVYAFSIDNFRRTPHEVAGLIDLLREKMEAIVRGVSFVNDAGIRILFVGNLALLDAPTRDLARQAEAATVGNVRLVLIICIAYTSTDEILRCARAVCEEEWARAKSGIGSGSPGERVTVAEIERRMGFAGHPEPDILVRTSGETRLSNFMLWQTGGCLLDAPASLWPELSLPQILSVVIRYQRHYRYLQKARSKIQNYGLYNALYANSYMID
ncbi:Dehydrodolichyl diphosphate synthase 6 [Apostasia shenzhenica]|uniref:Alkyl transferase n=1 Tax=Apostasia shenzhenica TaxID=1088818 RepID=A0A2H9ZWV3_9ASPA|nr:Dehydrodolichyl diphosphate synthase 6 [Apostasia shenzhenica]